MHQEASYGNLKGLAKNETVPLDRTTVMGRSICDGKPIHIADILTAGNDFPSGRQLAVRFGHRTTLAVPLLHEGRALGTILVRRIEVRPFEEKHISLLQTFADQAVIAIGNVRMFEQVQARTRDLTESLQQQTATADVLKVISRSAFDLQPVLDTIVETASRLCAAEYAFIYKLQDDGKYHMAANHGADQLFLKYAVEHPLTPGRGSLVGRTALERKTVHMPDCLADPEYVALEYQSVGHYRSNLGVPLLREGVPIGVIILMRAVVMPFTDRQIELVTTFADQAVIAIENVSLFDEVQAKTRDLSESLQQQTATADVLKVISRSAFDLQTVLDTLLSSAATLCEAEKGVIFLREDSHFLMVSNYGFSAEFEAFARAHPYPADSGSTTTRSAASGVTVHVADVLADDTQSDLARQYQRLGGHRTIVGVPLRRERETIGVFTLTRQVVYPFTKRQIELVETFADQAVIAIQNVRLFDEVQAKTRDLTESLQQQTATADVLKVISASPGELEPVFQAMLENAVRLCEAQFAMLFLYEKEKNEYRAVGKWNLPPAWREFLEKNPIRADPRVPLGRIAITKQPVQVADVLADQAYIDRYPGMVAVAELGGARTLLQVPLLKENELVGAFGIYRQEVRPFTDKQIALVRNFAAQAVIAMENARLLNELRQRTDDLSESLNDLRTAQDRLVQTEKLASLGQLTAGIAHEIKNPLNFVNNFSALSAELTDELNDTLKPVVMDGKVREEVDELTGMLKDNLEKVVQHGKRADSIVKNMLLHSREGSGEHRLADINAIVDESLNLAYHGARAEKGEFNITLQRDFDADAGTIELFPQEITRAFLNLIANGVYAATKRKTEERELGFEPTLRASTKNLGTTVEIRIRDNGTGILAEVQEKMFNPFFTTKPAGEGTGLGLSMTHDIIVKQHGGTIDVVTEPGIFTEFVITLPRAIIPPRTAGGTN
jgi:GAF domain-containing protein